MIAALSLLLLLLLSFLPQTLTLTLTPTPDGGDGIQNYIVRFTQYKPSRHHRDYLSSSSPSLLGSEWSWIERRNSASEFPTDFGLVSIEDGVRDRVVREIEGLGLVKDVSLDWRYTRGVLEDSGERVEDVVWRKGKRFTRMSWEGDWVEEEEARFAGVWNATAGDLGKRVLMMQVEDL